VRELPGESNGRGEVLFRRRWWGNAKTMKGETVA
jgi:hypothetical protein